MPNRIIKESIHVSDKVNQMSDFQFRLWVNLITYVDDYGRGDARPAIIKGTCFPLRERLTNKDIEAALHGLADIGCVALYKVDGKPYLCFPNWGSHQNIRNKKSKFPKPPAGTPVEGQLAISCEQLQSNDSGCSRNPNPNPYPNTNPNPNPNSNPNDCAEPSTASAPEPELESAETDETDCPVFYIPLNDNSMWPVTQDMLNHWQQLYPAVNVSQEIRSMIGWCESNPQKRKTSRGVMRFVTGWLKREQDRGGNRSAGNPPRSGGGQWTFEDFQ